MFSTGGLAGAGTQRKNNQSFKEVWRRAIEKYSPKK
jgi:hypothetical protein